MQKIASVMIMALILSAFSAGGLRAAEKRAPTPEEFKEMMRQYNESGKINASQQPRQLPKHVEQFNRALALHSKKDATPGELKEAAGLYQEALDDGMPQAATNLALLYLEGKGVKKDIKKVLSLLKKASAKNDSQADIALARLYLTGKDVPKDEKKGESLLNKAAKTGNQNAVKMLADYREWKKKNEKAMKEYQDIMKQLQAQQNKQRAMPPLQFMSPPSPAAIPYPVIPGYEYVSGKKAAMPNFIALSPQLPPQVFNILPQKSVALSGRETAPPAAIQPITIVPQGNMATMPLKVEAGAAATTQKSAPPP